MFSFFSLLREGEYLLAIISILSRCFVVFCCLPIHEFAHAWTANRLGDNTAKYQGRLTINPFAHLDPIGTIMIFLIGIGYAKPVSVNPSRLKHPRRDFALVALAGPLSNLVMAFISIFICYAFWSINAESMIVSAVSQFFYFSAEVNVALAVFNLIPVPPLDGSRILNVALPDRTYFKIMEYERYIMIGFMAAVFFGLLDGPIAWLSNIMMNFISVIPRLIF